MRLTDFDIYRDILIEKSGLVIDQEKSYLLDSRLGPIARKWGYSSIEAMTAALHGVASNDLVSDIVQAMVTNDTSFFRDAWPFEALKTRVLPYLQKNRGRAKKIRAWSAAASTGQEPYSIGMVFKEMESQMPGLKPEILGTDICGEFLERAKTGIYSSFEAQRGLSIRYLLKYFKQIPDNKWEVKDPVRKMVRYQPFNLLDNMATLGKFDIVFCRNVLENFDRKTRRKTLEKIAKQLEKDGFFFAGGLEEADGVHDFFVPLDKKGELYGRADGPHQ